MLRLIGTAIYVLFLLLVLFAFLAIPNDLHGAAL
jgi:hypothetical protein